MIFLALAALAIPHALIAWLLYRAVSAALEGWPEAITQRQRAELFIAQQPGGLKFLARKDDQ